MPAALVPWSAPPEVPRLTPRQIHLWRFRLDLSANHIAELHTLLSPDERSRAQRLINPLKSHAFIAGRGRLRQILGRYLVCDPATLRFGYSAAGKPFLAADHPGSFNLAHSGPWGLLGIAESGVIGVDVECLNAQIDFRQIARRFFTEAERTELEAHPLSQQRQVFYAAWTAREAGLKAVGAGFSGPIENCATRSLRLYHFLLAPHYLGALAADPGSWETRHWDFPIIDSE